MEAEEGTRDAKMVEDDEEPNGTESADEDEANSELDAEVAEEEEDDISEIVGAVKTRSKSQRSKRVAASTASEAEDEEDEEDEESDDESSKSAEKDWEAEDDGDDADDDIRVGNAAASHCMYVYCIHCYSSLLTQAAFADKTKNTIREKNLKNTWLARRAATMVSTVISLCVSR